MKPLSEQSLYEILEVPPDASRDEIVQAWERMQAVYGPGSLAIYTLMAPEEAELLGARLEEARSVLLDPVARHDYDARLLRSASLSGTPLPLVGSPADVSHGGRPAPALVQALREPAEARTPAPATPAQLELIAAAEVAPARSELPVAATPPPAPPVAPPPVQPVIVLRNEVVPGPPPAASDVGPPEPRPIPLEAVAPVSPPFAAVAPDAPGPAPAPALTPAPRSARPRATPPERELFVPEGTPYGGEVLRRAREARGLTVEQVCQRTKILRQHVENLEADRHDRLPAPVYLRGILIALSKELRLDGQKVARSYLETMAAARESGKGR